MKLWIAILLNVTLFAAPSGFQSTSATYHVDRSGAHVITSGSQAIVNWESFSLAKGEAAKFLQKNGQSAVLNRVTGGSLSKIYGQISSNGKVLFVNRSGVMIGPHATIDCAGFLASTANIPDDAFLAGGELLFKDFGEGEIVNLGTINSPAGDVILLAKSVENKGTISAENVYLAAGTEVLLKPTGPVFIQSTLGEVGKSNPYALAVKTEGKITAQTLTEEGGRIFLLSDGGTAEVKGTLVTSGTAGGEVRIEGAKTFVSKEATIDADGYSGDGGNVLVWGDETAHFFGKISCEAKGEVGDGGFVEVSAKENDYQFRGKVSTLSKCGEAGMLLLDPITLNVTSTSPSTPAFSNPYIPVSPPDTANLFADDLTGALASTPVSIASTGAGAGTGDITFTTNVIWSSEHGLTVTADRGVVVNSGVTVSNSDDGFISLTGLGSGASSQEGVTIAGTVSVNNGTLTLDGTGTTGGAGEDGVFISSVGSVISTGSGEISITGASPTSGLGIDLDGFIDAQGTGGITLDGTSGTGTSLRGVLLSGASATITSTTGAIDITGTSAGTAGQDCNGIELSSSASIGSTGSTGNITLNGTGGPSNVLRNRGVEINGVSTISVVDAAISITGTGGGDGTGVGSDGDGNIGVLTSGTIQATGDGTITLDGTMGLGTRFCRGISIGGGSIETQGSGSILITGRPGLISPTSAENQGIFAVSSIIQATGSGSVTLDGTGAPGGTIRNRGVQINSSATISVVGGAIDITGVAGGTADTQSGIRIDGTVQATGDGTITLDGTMGPGVRFCRAISMSGGHVETQGSGLISFTGKPGVISPTASENAGIFLFNSAIVQATGSGSITFNGTGGGGTGGNYGVWIFDGSVSVVGGTIDITGVGGDGSTTDNTGINIEGTAEAIGSGGDIILKGTGGGGAASNQGLRVSGSVTVTDGIITVTGNGG